MPQQLMQKVLLVGRHHRGWDFSVIRLLRPGKGFAQGSALSTDGEAFGYPFMELAHPTGRKKLVSKKGPQAGAAYGIELAGLLCPQ